MVSFVAALVFGKLVQDQTPINTAQGRASLGIKLPNSKWNGTRSMLVVYQDRLPMSKLTPRKMGTDGIHWEFDFNALGQCAANERTAPVTRFSIYTQERKQTGDLAPVVGRMLVRLWEHCFDSFKLDHPYTYKFGIIDVYLCFGGKAGGEQMFDVDPQYPVEHGGPRPVNTIYIYDLASFKDPLEMAREVAHEYGHAVIPGIGGFKTPEDWANGFLGERIFLSWMRNELAAGRLTTDDTMGATKAALDAYVKANVDPFVLKGGLKGPALLTNSKDAPKMEAYLSLVAAQHALLPEGAFGRALRLVGSTDVKDVPDSFVLAVEELDAFDITIPPVLRGQAVWLPVGARKIAGGKILARSGKWCKIQPTSPTVHIAGRGEPISIGQR